MVVSDAAVATGHCLAVGIDVETGVVDVGGEWAEWAGDCDVLHACAQFYSHPGGDVQGRGSSGSNGSNGSDDDDDYAQVGTEPGAPTDALVGAIIADLKERMEVNIKARIPVASGA